MWIGSHVSIRNGYLRAAQFAKSIGATSFQYFPKNPRTLGVKDFDRTDAESCKKFCQASHLRSIAHMPYPANIATSDPTLRQRVIASLRNDLDIAEACGSDGVVVHFGKYKDENLLEGYQNCIQCLNDVLCDWQGHARILIENESGAGTHIGKTFEECVMIRKLSQHSEYIGFCLDTCHLFASGVWDGKNTQEIVQLGIELGYWRALGAIHLNDSVYDSGKHRDRHAPIGRGYIGVDTLREFLSYDFAQQIPIVMETPKGADGTHREEISLVQNWNIRD